MGGARRSAGRAEDLILTTGSLRVRMKTTRSTSSVAIVTGAAHGIGRAIALLLLDEGWRVGAVDLPGSGLKRNYAKQLRRVVLIEGDVADEETAPRAVEAVTERFGRLDGLVSNAGIMVRRPLRTLSLAQWRKVLDTNLTATFLFARAAEKPLRAAGGAIVTIASTRALMSEPDTESYSASKGGLVALTHALAISLAPRVRVELRQSRLDSGRTRGAKAASAQGSSPASRRSGWPAARHRRAGGAFARWEARWLHHRCELHGRWRDDQEDDLRGIDTSPHCWLEQRGLVLSCAALEGSNP